MKLKNTLLSKLQALITTNLLQQITFADKNAEAGINNKIQCFTLN